MKKIPKIKKNNSDCCSTEIEHHLHPDHKKELVKIKRARGQLDGIMAMIDNRRYCPDILIQIRAAKSALQSVEHSILKSHLKSCVHDAVVSKEPKAIENKISELIELLDRHI